MAELLRNPKMIVKVQEEIRQVIGLNGIVQDLDIVKLPYLQASSCERESSFASACAFSHPSKIRY